MNREERRQHLQPKSPFNKNKWIVIGLGTILGISHVGMIGMLANRSRLPVVNLPVGPYTSYQVNAGEKGYTINYRANDPLVMEATRNIKRPGGFLGLGTKTIQTRELYTVDGSRHLESNSMGKSLSDKKVACIKAEGGGEGTGRMVGGAVGATVGTSGLASIPYVGWVLAGAATIIGMEQGAEIGGEMAKDFSDACEEEIEDK